MANASSSLAKFVEEMPSTDKWTVNAHHQRHRRRRIWVSFRKTQPHTAQWLWINVIGAACAAITFELILNDIVESIFVHPTQVYARNRAAWSNVKIFEYLPCSFKARQRFLFVWMKWWIIFLQHWMHYVKNKFYIFLGFSKHMLLPATHDYFQSFPIVKGATCECFCWEIFVCTQDSVGKHLTFSFSYCKSDFFFRSCSLQPNRSVRKDCVGCI